MVALAAAILAAFTPPAVDRTLDRDWCSPAAYAQARRVPHLDLTARRNLFEAAALAREHPRGCRLAESAARRRGQRLPDPRKLHCARPLPLPAHGARHDAARAAAAATGRGLRPIVVSFGGRGA